MQPGEPAMITYRCPHCSVLKQEPERKAGKMVNCPHCKQVSVCPHASVVVPLRPDRPVRKKKKVGNPDFFAALGAIGLACLYLVIR
jgi:DNA-directed RNA polymerase subunit RPC12/RpoP